MTTGDDSGDKGKLVIFFFFIYSLPTQQDCVLQVVAYQDRNCPTHTSNSRKGQRTSQKYRNLVGSDQQVQRLEKTKLRKADRTVGVQCI